MTVIFAQFILFTLCLKLEHHLLLSYNVYGAIILTDPSLANSISTRKLNRHYRTKGNESYHNFAVQRLENGRQFAKTLPFHVSEWWSVTYGPCPLEYRPVTKETQYLNVGNNRGVLMAHKQIWENFLYEERYMKNTTDSDILAIFEDDAVSCVTNITWSLHNEFSDMTTDFLYLGWCHGDKPGKLPMCTHAYALTRQGLRKMLPELDVCGSGIDGQFINILRAKVASWRKAKYESYGYSLLPGFKPSGGIFKQVNTLASFNYHPWNKTDRH